ncbi:MAG: type 2 isopentenyl-diphosphate Delta-isomerase [Candidatus Heimdallarchaeota archaeon]|nr:type 2 isopentenyl-diphosphate Delta-isomerase [Candidatus Heimdallarchaeota archaeon]MCG3253201.1 type 2 isopentenyl-diphosphate Delta-isomerase [Candidatus Heimdallarchaeota archaeon]MCK4290338.1 type 2 isopentenyl-diphosphate Delta-isomerase [Candidatus Heimdallarchaeota archaeon]
MTNKKVSDETANRKQDHIEICCNKLHEIEMSVTTGFEDIHFVPNALPDINLDNINMNTEFLKHDFDYPIFISSITGGTKLAKKINSRLAKLAEKYNIGMGVGSQRAAIEDEANTDSFTIVRQHAPNAFVAANLGAVQFNYDFTIKHAEEAVEMINADALIVHLNPLQEVIQPEGNTNFSNLTTKIKEIGKKLKQPLIVKEVGSGISQDIALDLVDGDIPVIDVAGAGGTSWSQIEAIRAKQQGLTKEQRVGELFKDWGLPTAVSTIEVGKFRDRVEIISSGGIRNGLQAAKALAIGAKLVGIALPLACLAATGTEKELINWLEQFIYELKTTMFLVGAEELEGLQYAPMTVTGKTAEWLNARGLLEELEMINLRG